ncbi:SIMPL domain-containing protein [Myxosarcina sp. GI1]|uniref:SIMPL domain-containing protein n=1 Tax=Myxosarcina sp. GI1 TaxID=1541065 RepID=UPI000691E1BC|nr:SIMPL domain-containing protein [Myxosarcina sp. GI1]
MKATNKAIFKETDIKDKEDLGDRTLTKPSEFKTATDTANLDLLTGANSTDSLFSKLNSDLLLGDVTFTKKDNLKILEVTGKGVVSVDTDTAQIQLGIEAEGATATKVQQKVAKNTAAVVKQLDLLEVEELQTVSISLEPKLKFDNQGNSTVVGFTGRNILQFEISTEQAGETIDAALKAGANVIENIDFIAPESEFNQARLDAIELAVKDAQNQAVSVFNTLDLKPLEIVDIDVMGVSSPSATSSSPEINFLKNAAAFDVSTPIIGGSQEVVAEVALDINYAAL